MMKVAGLDAPAPLEDYEFRRAVVRKADGTWTLKLAWADRCIDSYRIKYCRVPLECDYEDAKSSVIVKSSAGNR